MRNKLPASEITFTKAKLLAVLSGSNSPTSLSGRLQFIALNALKAPGSIAYRVGTDRFRSTRRWPLRSR